MITATKFEPLGESEEELEEEATELEPLFSRGKAIAPPFGEEEWEPDVLCPSPTRTTVSGFSRYSSSVASLPPDAQTRVRNVASLILRSFRPSYQPIVAVRLVGHADYDPLRELFSSHRVCLSPPRQQPQPRRRAVPRPPSGRCWPTACLRPPALASRGCGVPRAEVPSRIGRRYLFWKENLYEAVRPVLTGERFLRQQSACWVWANKGSRGRLDGGRISAVLSALLHNGGRQFSAPTVRRFPPEPARRSGWPPPSP
jgi:hypothetical protein